MIKVEIPRRLVNQAKRACKAGFPNERVGFLLGLDAGDLLLVEQIYWPDDQASWCHRASATMPDHWWLDAAGEAVDEDLVLLGDIHSHPYPHASCGSFLADPVQSETDLSFQWGRLHGVVAINQRASGVLVARLRLWHSIPPVVVHFT